MVSRVRRPPLPHTLSSLSGRLLALGHHRAFPKRKEEYSSAGSCEIHLLPAEAGRSSGMPWPRIPLATCVLPPPTLPLRLILALRTSGQSLVEVLVSFGPRAAKQGKVEWEEVEQMGRHRSSAGYSEPRGMWKFLEACSAAFCILSPCSQAGRFLGCFSSSLCFLPPSSLRRIMCRLATACLPSVH